MRERRFVSCALSGQRISVQSERGIAMFFESFLLNLAVLAALIVALIFDYVTKFFSYWYVRHVPYKTPVPFFGSDYHRVLLLRSTSEEVKILYSRYPDSFVGTIKSRIPDLLVKQPDAIKKILSTDFANFHSRGLALDKSKDVCLRNNPFYAEGEKWTLLREALDLILNGAVSEINVSLHEHLTGTNGVVNAQQLLTEILDAVFKNCLFAGNEDGSLLSELRKSLQRRTYIEKFKSYLKELFPSVFVSLGLVTAPEALRLYPPYSVINRKCVKAYNMSDSGMALDKKVTVTVPVDAIHKDPVHYRNPYTFDPDRFLERENNAMHAFTYLPFGAGPRKCNGEQLALKIIRTVTEAVIKEYKIEVTDETPTELKLADHDFKRTIISNVWLKFTRSE
ncbi:unnamed protein product, partial [Iphiclides podalirius]